MENINNVVVPMFRNEPPRTCDVPKTLTLWLDDADWVELGCLAKGAGVTLEEFIEGALYDLM